MSTGNLNKSGNIEFTVYGEPASKANSRRLVMIKGKPAFIKSKKALMYEKTFAPQCPQLDPIIEVDVSVTITIYYASRRPDLDESVILDCMQAVKKKINGEQVILRNNVYLNDRQVKHKDITWALDRKNPRAEIRVEPLDDC